MGGSTSFRKGILCNYGIKAGGVSFFIFSKGSEVMLVQVMVLEKKRKYVQVYKLLGRCPCLHL